MALKILSGKLVPKGQGWVQNAGKATITFSPHAVSGDANGAHLNMAGATGDFIDKPCCTISLQNVVFQDQCNTGDPSLGDAFRSIAAQLYIESITKDELIVKWECTPMSEVHGISYMVIGDVAEEEPREEKRPAKP